MLQLLMTKYNRNSIINFISSLADTKQDTPKQKQEHRFLIFIGFAMSIGGLVWGTITLVNGYIFQSLFPYSYTAITIMNFSYLYYTKNFKVSQTVQIIISLLIPFAFQFALGGFISSGAVILWSILTILVSFTFQKKDMALRWFYIYVILIVASGIFDNNFREYTTDVSADISVLFFTLNITLVSIAVFTLFFYFINSNEKLQEELVVLANTDLLTSLPNRRYFFENSSKEFMRSKRHSHDFSLLMLDIDFFKSFNDSYGHDFGDEVLMKFANLLKENIREIDILCRYGGEEFIILLPQTKVDEAIISAQRIIDNCRKLRIDTKKSMSKVTVSIGVTQIIDSDTNIEDIIKRTDEALYLAKQNGRDQYQVI